MGALGLLALALIVTRLSGALQLAMTVFSRVFAPHGSIRAVSSGADSDSSLWCPTACYDCVLSRLK